MIADELNSYRTQGVKKMKTADSFNRYVFDDGHGFSVALMDRNSPEINEVYDLYQEAFPDYERKPFEMILDGLETGKMETYSVFYDHQYAGLVFLIKGEHVDVLDYLAVNGTMRDHGIGGRILAWLRGCRENPFVVEIESTLTSDDPIHRKRKDFYLANEMKDCRQSIELFGVDMELMSSLRPITYEEYFTTMKDYFDHDVEKWVKRKD